MTGAGSGSNGVHLQPGQAGPPAGGEPGPRGLEHPAQQHENPVKQESCNPLACQCAFGWLAVLVLKILNSMPTLKNRKVLHKNPDFQLLLTICKR